MDKEQVPALEKSSSLPFHC